MGEPIATANIPAKDRFLLDNAGRFARTISRHKDNGDGHQTNHQISLEIPCRKISEKKRIRKNFGKIQKIVDIPDLIGVQRESFSRFLQIEFHRKKGKTSAYRPYSNRCSRLKILQEVLLWNSFRIGSVKSNTM